MKDAKFSESDLKKLAFWMAAGSDKTLIMHINYRQFLHYNNLPAEAPAQASHWTTSCLSRLPGLGRRRIGETPIWWLEGLFIQWCSLEYG